MANLALLIIVVTLTTVTSQTFQYSRGWTNGKRDGHRRSDALEKILSPCQVEKLKYLLEGKPFNDRLLISCQSTEDDSEMKRFRPEHQDTFMDVFQ
ncbi:unnamed protein product [Leptidea sinapis]|uniref:Pro-corazonin n=1 Tax=Leptidea sinapis TaxID=189913 RepID=A0A5E4QSV3_9NEOP|nr:unnamed protein product [Leptidea sinapis]